MPRSRLPLTMFPLIKARVLTSTQSQNPVLPSHCTFIYRSGFSVWHCGQDGPPTSPGFAGFRHLALTAWHDVETSPAGVGFVSALGETPHAAKVNRVAINNNKATTDFFIIFSVFFGIVMLSSLAYGDLARYVEGSF